MVGLGRFPRRLGFVCDWSPSALSHRSTKSGLSGDCRWFFGCLSRDCFHPDEADTQWNAHSIGLSLESHCDLYFSGLYLETKIRVFLLTKVTIVVFNLFDLLGFELEREGNVLILPEGQVGVEEACSGIRSLTACLFAGSFLAAVFLNRFWKKILLVAAAMCFAVLTNLLRSLFLTFWAYQNGAHAIDEHWVLPILGDIGSVHDVTGFAILGVTCVGLICLLPIFNFQLKDLEEEYEDNFDSDADSTTDKKAD